MAWPEAWPGRASLRQRELHFSRKAEEKFLCALEDMFSRSTYKPSQVLPCSPTLAKGPQKQRNERAALNRVPLLAAACEVTESLWRPAIHHCPLMGSDAMLRFTTLRGPGPCTGPDPQQVTSPAAVEVFSVFETLKFKGVHAHPKSVFLTQLFGQMILYSHLYVETRMGM